MIPIGGRDELNHRHQAGIAVNLGRVDRGRGVPDQPVQTRLARPVGTIVIETLPDNVAQEGWHSRRCPIRLATCLVFARCLRP